MAKWELHYHPPKGERRSPANILTVMCRPVEAAAIYVKIATLLQTEKKDWGFPWLKTVKGMYYVRSGDFRVYFNVTGNKLVICHMCRKTSQKAKDNDNEIALAHWKEFTGG